MSKVNYKRSAGSSLIPRYTRLSESERQERMLSRANKGAHYSGLGIAARSGTWKPIQPRLTEEQKVEQRAHLARKRLIKEIVEG